MLAPIPEIGRGHRKVKHNQPLAASPKKASGVTSVPTRPVPPNNSSSPVVTLRRHIHHRPFGRHASLRKFSVMWDKALEENQKKHEKTLHRWNKVRKFVKQNKSIHNAFFQYEEEVHKVIKILQKSIDARSVDEIGNLYNWMKSQESIASLLYGMSDIAGKAMCRTSFYDEYVNICISEYRYIGELDYAAFSSNEIVCDQGDTGKSCFILLSGSVEVFVRNQEEQRTYENLKQKSEAINKRKQSSRLLRMSSISADQRYTELLDHIGWGTKVAVLKPGAIFGELCLLNPGALRTATIRAEAHVGRVSMMVLSSSVYERIIRSQDLDENVAENVRNLKNLLMFQPWSDVQIQRLANTFKFHTYAPARYLFRQGQEMDGLMILVSGEARESVTLSTQEQLVTNASKRMERWENNLTAEVTFLSRFDIIGEALVSSVKKEKAIISTVDVRAVTTVEVLFLSKALIRMHLRGIEGRPDYNIKCTNVFLKAIHAARTKWRVSRMTQILEYSDLKVAVSRKMMRLSETICTMCGKTTHIVGDVNCPKHKQLLDLDRQKANNNALAAADTETSNSQLTELELLKTMAGVEPSAGQHRPSVVTTEPIKEEPDDKLSILKPGSFGRSLVRESWKQTQQVKRPFEKDRPVSNRTAPVRSQKELNQTIALIRQSWPYNMA